MSRIRKAPISGISSEFQEEVKKGKVEAEAFKRVENVAAVLLQRHVRGWLTRRRLKFLNRQATTIQRFYRGYRGRVLAAQYTTKKYESMIENYYNREANKIQALWRGYQSRKEFDYYRYRAWINSTLKANQEILAKMEEFNEAEIKRKEEETASEFEPWVHYMATKLHHMLRTKVKPGIYSTLGSMELSEIEKIISNYKYKDFIEALRAERLHAGLASLFSRDQTKKENCLKRATDRRCVNVMRAKHTISNPRL